MGRIMRTYPRALAALVTAIVTAGVAVAQQATTVGTLDGHTDPVYAIAWSPDGKTLATAGFDNTVRLWDAATRKEIKKYEGHSKLVLAVAIAPDGKHILSGSQDNTAKIWDCPDLGPGQDVRRSCRPRSQALAVKPDGKQFAAASGKSIKVWDLATGAARQGPRRTRGRGLKRLPGAVTAASSPPATKPTPSGSGKATSHRKRRSKRRPRASSAWLIFPNNQHARLGRLGRAGPALAASGRRAAAVRLQGAGRRPLPSAATAPSWPPPGPTRSSASGTRPTAN